MNTLNNNIKQRIGAYGCILLSCIFIVSAITKSVNISSFTQETRLYIDAYMAQWIQPLTGFASITVCVIEMLIALFFLKSEYRRLANLGFFLMLSFFVYLTGINYLCPSIMGSIESCGCFGELIHFTAEASFIKSIVLWIISAVTIWVILKDSTSKWNIGKLLHDKFLYLSIATSLALPMYSLLLFESLEHTIYMIGFAIICVFIALTVGLYYWKCIKTKKNVILSL